METNTNWNHSTAAVCMQNGKVLLARHTYGGGKGKLIIPAICRRAKHPKLP